MSDHMSTVPPRPTNGDILALNESTPLSSTDPKLMSVNRKKQKRRQKQAARLAERQLANGVDLADRNGHSPESHLSDDLDFDPPTNGDAYHDDDLIAHQDLPSVSDGQQKSNRKSKKKKGKKNRSGSQTLGDESSTPLSTPSVSVTHPLPPPLPPHLGPRTMLKPSKDRSIWNTSTQEERENIKTFWLELGEDERRQLVKVEKDAVLKKMKEQQKHSCSCTVCGRKRTAIEEELEVLYDAYYEELEQYANNNQNSFEKGAPIVPPPRLYHPPLRSPGQHTRTHGQYHPSRGRIHELPEDDEDLEEDYDEDDEDDEPYSDEEYEDEETRAARADFFAFGNSLTVKDDLLKNDGKHFIDMMEQLAERRMQREEETQYGIAAAHQSLHSGHNHGPYDDEDYDDEEDEDYDSQEEEDYEEDEMVCANPEICFGEQFCETNYTQDAMTEEQRMEEGRRMFQIFAARMFEQRVLTAYREKVAEQRQQKLIEELMEEETRNEQRNAKKAREAEKRKEKKRLQKQAKEEEKARREAEKAAEEAAAKAEHEKKLEEQRKKREEQRKKREAERKAQEEERARKEAEKTKRLREERERQAETERKQREQKEQEKKRRDEVRRKEREERELREKRVKEDRERKVREEQDKKRDPHAKPSSQLGPVPIPTMNMYHPGGHLQSPHFQAATPIVPKAPTPVKARQSSQQGSHTSSPRSQPASTEPSQPSISPRSMAPSQSSGASSVTSKQGHSQQPMLHHPQPSTPLSPLGALGRSIPPGFSGSNGLPPNPPGLPGLVPRAPISHELPTYPPHSTPLLSQLRGFPAPNGIPIPPGINGARPMPPGRGFPLDPGHGFSFHSQQPLAGPFSGAPSGLSHAHTRQPSNSFERSPLDSHAQLFPISRPSPIKRPSSTQQEQQGDRSRASRGDVDNLSAQLGSSALLDDSDIPFTSNLSQSLPGATTPGSLPGPARASFAAPSLFPDPLSGPKHTNFPMNSGVGGSTWGAQLPFGATAFPGAPTWGSVHGNGWSNNAFGSAGHHRAHTSRPVSIRLLVIQACKQLNTMSPSKGVSGYHDVKVVLRQVDQLRPFNEPSISLKEMLDICDTEGNSQNGGGSFSIRSDETGEYVKFEPDTNSATSGHRGSIVPGEIGSPVPSSSLPAFSGLGSTPSVLRQFPSTTTGF
ncbi:salt tolerance down-regulator-domain-containing protein [Aspergillus avenaceus]|uniref:Stress response protein NST1 n=1 Tax=Aspergillus avenaceus TaxID=36643 RepID=A0A5N6TD84_ASPAV|nr:salt tolerance down-regulator-domain-containing protein [Aspergillus avenaceus]